MAGALAIGLAIAAPAPQAISAAAGAPFQVRHATNQNFGESYIHAAEIAPTEQVYTYLYLYILKVHKL